LFSPLDDLRVVGLDGLVLHEAHDEARLLRLRNRMEDEAVQRDPVVVSPQGEQNLILDGAHRVHALAGLGCRFVLAQVVSPAPRAEGWAHLLDRGAARSLDGLESVETSPDPTRGWLAKLEAADGEPGGERYVRARGEGLLAQVRALWEVRRIYPENGVIRRINPGESADGAVIYYRSFSPGELVEVVRHGEILPAGVTRFKIPSRILGVRYPLERLMEGDLASRAVELRGFVEERRAAGRIRRYEEPVVLFE
jgi:hypothetical protein